jgi:hypothetical protein
MSMICSSDLGLVDSDGRPDRRPAAVIGSPATVVRSCLLTISSCSAPGRPVHLEIRSPSRAVSADIAVRPAAPWA